MKFSSTALLLALTIASAFAAGDSFVNFESGQVRPLALSPDGTLLFATNTPDNRLAIYAVTSTGLQLTSEVPVGLEPVAVAVRPDGAGSLHVWVVNHLSDSVSIVHVNPSDVKHARVVGTLLVGDEPRDIVFAGAQRGRAFITTARRGQNLPPSIEAKLTTAGVPRALVWVFDAADPFADTSLDPDSAPSPLGGEPLAVLELFGDSPRALAVSSDGSRVYAAIFLSGNRTTSVNAANVADHGGLPPPPTDSPYYPDGFPQTALIVRNDPTSGQWRDELARDWSADLRLSLPDADIFTIDADGNPPFVLPGATSDVGTVLYGMAVRSSNGALFVSNTEARNDVRFAPLVDATHGLQGRFVDNRITIVSPAGTRAVGLNPHVDYSRPTGPAAERDESLSTPTALAFSADGSRLYASAFGSEAVAIFDAAALEAGIVNRVLIRVGGGPSGIVVDDVRERLYALNRFDQTISVIEDVDDVSAVHVAATVNIGFDPSPPEVKHGRRFLFDGRLSGHGDVSCASCHVFADFDGLGWDLGDPYGPMVPNPNAANLPPWHPMKGPMTTQSLRGLAQAGPMHWRGDRTAAASGGNPLDTDGAFKTFNPAFVGLLGGVRELTAAEMQSFTDWVLTIRYPPNPVARLDGIQTQDEISGAQSFDASGCRFCHSLDLGSGPSVTLSDTSEGLKVPHLRNLYTKVGMFGQQSLGALFPMPYLGDQIRGFGYFHDGANAVLELPQILAGNPHVPEMDAFLLAFPTGLAPSVGQQFSATPANVNDAATLSRRDLLVDRSNAGDCDLIVRGVIDGEERGALHLGAGDFETDRAGAPHQSLAQLWSQAGVAGNEQLWTCVPPGTGRRTALDRDEDGYFDGDEVDAGTSPIDSVSHPGGPLVVPISSHTLRMKGNPRNTTLRFRFTAKSTASSIAPPSRGSAGDPTTEGAIVRIYNGAGSGEQQTFNLPASGWRPLKNGFVFRSSDQGIKFVSVRSGGIVIRSRSSASAFTLDEPAQRRMVLRLTLGNAVDWCAESVASGNGTVDRARLFKARDTSAPQQCQSPPAG